MGALMLSLHINHPDSMEFIKVKRDKESVTGANISLRLSDEFMRAVEHDAEYYLRFPVDTKDWLLPAQKNSERPTNTLLPTLAGKTKYIKKINALEYWKEIVHSATHHAEPGIMYWDNVLRYDPAAVYERYKPISSNPCVSGDTLVLTPNGYREAKTIEEGDILSTVIGSEPVKTKEVNKDVQLYKVKFSDGGEIRVTANHQFHVRVKDSKYIEEKKLKHLKVGDSVRISGNTNVGNIEYGEDYKRGLKRGILLGDACYTEEGIEGNNIKIASNQEYSTYNNNLKTLFGEDKFRADDVSKDSKSVSFAFKTNYAEELCRELDLEPPFSYEKNVDLSKGVSIEETLGILDGLLATDGNVNLSSNHPQVSFFTTSKKLAENIRLMLLSLGSYGVITESKDKGGSIKGREIQRNHVRYSINVSGESFRNYALKSFLSKIHPEKGEELISALSTAILSGNNWSTKIVSIEEDKVETVYDFYCETSDTWITNGYVSRGCGEQFLNANDSCRLTALNLFGFVNNPFTSDAYIDYEKLYQVSYEHLILGDTLVDIELEYIQRIIDKIDSDPEPEEIKNPERRVWEKSLSQTKAGRRVGLGITALGDMLASVGVKYGTDESIEVVRKVMQTKMKAELNATIDLAILKGTFEGFDTNKEYVIDQSGKVVEGRNDFYQMLLEEFPEEVSRMVISGRRSVSWSTIAPTGSVSLLTQTTSGCEPLFKAYYVRRTKINDDDVNAKVDFVDDLGDKWKEHTVLHPKFKEFIQAVSSGDVNVDTLTVDDVEGYLKQSPWYGASADDISWDKRNEIQAMLQRYTTNAISSTINLPRGTSEEIVSQIYMQGWKLGLKGQTVYVDGSRDGVLVSANSKPDSKSEIIYNQAPQRPKVMPCTIHTTTSKGKKYNVIVGMLKDKPYEVFVMPHFTNDITSTLVKVKSGWYNLEKDGEVTHENLSMKMTDEQEAITRLVSTSLRHGVEIKFIVEQLNKTSSEDMFTFTRSLARVLKKYIPDGAKSTVKCPNCGSSNVVFEEGCNKCLDCGNSACS